MAVVTMRELLDSGVHFGHQTRRWNPKMKRYIFTERNGIYIIDIQQSLALIDQAYAFVKDTVARGGNILFVGTKKQAQEPIIEQAKRVGMPYVTERWLGGMLTNFQTMSKRVDTKKEHLAVQEAHKLGIPVIAILDTNCDPDEVEYKIPGNDDAIRSVALLTRVIADAVIAGMQARQAQNKPEPAAAAVADVAAELEAAVAPAAPETPAN